MIMDTDRVTGTVRCVGEASVASGMFSQTVKDLDDGSRLPGGLPKVNRHLVAAGGIELKCFVVAHVNPWR